MKGFWVPLFIASRLVHAEAAVAEPFVALCGENPCLVDAAKHVVMWTTDVGAATLALGQVGPRTVHVLTTGALVTLSSTTGRVLRRENVLEYGSLATARNGGEAPRETPRLLSVARWTVIATHTGLSGFSELGGPAGWRRSFPDGISVADLVGDHLGVVAGKGELSILSMEDGRTKSRVRGTGSFFSLGDTVATERGVGGFACRRVGRDGSLELLWDGDGQVDGITRSNAVVVRRANNITELVDLHSRVRRSVLEVPGRASTVLLDHALLFVATATVAEGQGQTDAVWFRSEQGTTGWNGRLPGTFVSAIQVGNLLIVEYSRHSGLALVGLELPTGAARWTVSAPGTVSVRSLGTQDKEFAVVGTNFVEVRRLDDGQPVWFTGSRKEAPKRDLLWH